jgi:ATP-dependent DNA helicase RecG
VGTHALLEDVVQFKALGLAVIDEQHRFGVDQRSKLWSKGAGAPPHVLVMTATPIPRTLAMTVYGDLDVSVIDEMPPGRKPVQTMCITPGKLPQMYNFIEKEIAAGRQAFIVFPMIFENDKIDITNIEQGYEEIVRRFPLEKGYKVALVHGQQNNDVKNFNMDAFAAGRAHILVSTTVIEVGVDVPNAALMIVENAERFGLSQLHQLRGRIGRGKFQSYCILVSDSETPEAKARLRVMKETSDGFKIAEADLRQRGPGDFFGSRQHGLPEMHVADLCDDMNVLEEARNAAQALLARDPDLAEPGNRRLKAQCDRLFEINAGRLN